jgi:polyvinyl alcohol dehydrogenase (cytochrome)
MWVKKRCLSLFLPTVALSSVVFVASSLSAQGRPPDLQPDQWRIAGQNLSNTWSQPAEHQISPANVKNLTPKWVFTTGGDVSATPTVAGRRGVLS